MKMLKTIALATVLALGVSTVNVVAYGSKDDAKKTTVKHKEHKKHNAHKKAKKARVHKNHVKKSDKKNADKKTTNSWF